MRLLLDQGLPRSAVSSLQSVGWDVVHVADTGMAAATDGAILEYARSVQRTVVTLDADFHAMLVVSGVMSPSVIRIRIEGLNGEVLAKLLVKLMPLVAHDLEQGAMITVTGKSVRVRLLGDVQRVR